MDAPPFGDSAAPPATVPACRDIPDNRARGIVRSMRDILLDTAAGTVRGLAADGVMRFRGIPYAAAPVGARRFAAPEPHPGWSGARDATGESANAPQRLRPFPAIDMAPLLGRGWIEGDDYLTLAIWAPEPAAAKLPVMVFIHGGAFVAGCNDVPVSDGTSLARAGVVYVSINYRLGIEGFLPIDGAPANLGLRDQIAALHWIRANIASFGGDPDNITLFGESAGAISVACLMAAPMADGLFHRAIIQSGHGSAVRPLATGQRLTAAVARILGIAPDRAGFLSTTAAQCLDALEQVQAAGPALDLRDPDGHNPAFGLTQFLPVHGDDLLPEPPLALLQRGQGAAIDLLIGANTDEMNLYLVPTGLKAALDPAQATALLTTSTPNAAELLAAYGLGEPGADAGSIFASIASDLAFRAPVRDFALAHQGTSHVYEFDWKSPAVNGQLGACHALDVPFVFQTIDCCNGANGILGGASPVDVAQRIQRLWVDFASGGTPPWPAYAPHNRQICLLASGAITADPLPDAVAHGSRLRS